ncbi:MAG: hypothetical protein JXK94_09185 [Deltaproteobacteria bacterium]|nr:hypothetical protein [Deltaproteobacteria bacterium]
MDQDCTSKQKSQPAPEHSVSTAFATLSAGHLKTMLRCVRALYRLSHNPLYQNFVANGIPASARLDPGHDSVMMGYDFHLTEHGPKLIEVNTNAGGALLPWLRADLGQPAEKDKKNLRDMFLSEFFRFSGAMNPPDAIVILDEKPEEQFLYPEMVCFANLFKEMGIKTCILDPDELKASAQGVFHDHEKVDLIYNRHTDFYLETEPMRGLREGYLAGRVCLTPNPRTYALLADKRRLALWSDEKYLRQFQVPSAEREILIKTILESHLMSDLDAEDIWSNKGDWVLKPLTKFGSRGVILGKKISRKRFDEFVPEETLVQKFVPPSLTPTQTDETLKTDFRLFVYRDKALGILARLFQGQVTNMRTPGGGFARVKILQD